MGIKFSNLASTTLASGVSSSTTSISVTSATSFPTLGSGDYFYASIGIGSASEVVKVTSISGTTFTAVRGQDSTTAISHSSGAEIALRVVAATLEDLRDATDNDTTYSAGTGVSLSGTTFSLTDTNSKLNLSGGTLTGGLSGTTGSFSGKVIMGGDGAIAQVANSVAADTSNTYTLAVGSQGGNKSILAARNINTSGGGYQINGNTVIDSSRNLTNIGTISSGAITSSGSVQIGASANLTWGGAYGSGKPTIAANTTTIYFYPTGNVSGQRLYLNATGLYNAGTLSSGTITTTGIQLLADAASNANDASLYLRRSNNNDWGLFVKGTSTATDYGVKVDLNGAHSYAFRGMNNTAEYFRVGTDMLLHNAQIRGNSFNVGTQEVITSGRNLTNIGTISSGAITSSGQINAGTNLVAGTSVYSNNGVYYGSTTLSLKNNTSGSFLSFAANTNATFAGTISSGAITSSSTGSFTGNVSANGVTIGSSDVRSSGGILTLGGTSEVVRIHSGNFDLTSGAFKVGGTTVIDASRNLTAVGGGFSGFLSNAGGAKLEIQNGTDGGNSRGIFMWTSTDTNWGIYMSTAGSGKSLSGDTACGSLDSRTSHHVRFRTVNGSVQGWIFENSSEAAKVSITSDTGNIFATGFIDPANGYKINGNTVIDSSKNITAGTISSGAITATSAYGGGSGDYINVTTPPLRIDGSTTYWRIPHESGHSTVSGVYGYETGKNVYWGEPTDTGTYYFRGRNVSLESSNLQMGGNTVIDSSRNLTNIGTISSGAITSSSTFSSTISGNNTTGGNIVLGPSSGSSKWYAITGRQYDSGTETEGYSLITGATSSGVNDVTIGGGLDEQNAATKVMIKASANSTTRNGTEVVRVTTDGLDVRNNVLRITGTTVIDSSKNLTNINQITSQGLTRTNTRINTSHDYPVGHYTPSDTVFEIDPTWSEAELSSFFGGGNVTWNADSTAPAGYAIYINGGVNVGGVYGSGFPFIPVGTNDIFYMECYVKNAGSGQTHYMGSNEFNQSFSSLGGNPGSYGYWVMSNTNVGSSWTKVSAYITGFGNSVGQFETGTKYWTPMALFNYGAGSGTRACYISGWKVIKVNASGNRTFEGLITASGNITTPKVSLTNSAYGIGVVNPNSGRFDTVDSGQNADPLELAYYSGSGVRVGQNGGDKYLSAGSIQITGTTVIDSSRNISGVTITASDAFRSNTWEDNGGTHLFKSGAGSGRTRHLNLADTTADPASVTDAHNPTGISWGTRSDNNGYYMLGLKGAYNNGYSTHSRLVVGWHTGLEIGSNPAYGGTRFFSDSPFVTTTEIMSVGKGDSHVRVANNLYCSGVTETPKLYLNGGNYEGSIVFGAVDVWRCGIRQHDDGDAELRIWAKHASGRVHIATGYDGQPASISRPTDGFVVNSNNVGIGNFSAVDPSEKLHVLGNILMSGGTMRASHSKGHQIGSYNNIAANSNKTNPIYTIGSSYNPSDTSVAGMYGIGYAHENLWGSGKSTGWGMYVVSGGTYDATISTSGIWSVGNITAYSDRRVKTNIEVIPNALEKVCKLNGYTFDRTDGGNDIDGNPLPVLRQTGVIAQEVLEVLPEAVTGSEEDHYSVAYGNMVGLLIESIKELKSEVDDLKTQLSQKEK